MTGPADAGCRRFEGRVAIVTGAGQGIGRATARRLGAEGAAVMVADLNEEGAERAAKDLAALGAPGAVFVGDLRDHATAVALAEETARQLGGIDVLVNAVGGSRHGPRDAWAYTPEQMHDNVEANLWTALWCCQAVVPHMLDRGGGAIVNVGSNAPRGTLRFPYAAAKGGVFAATTSLGLELAPQGIRVNAVAPHWTVSDDPDDRLVDRLGRPAGPSHGSPEATASRAERHLRNIPMGRPGTPEEQAAAIAFLASGDASFITAQVLSVAGGATAW